MNRQPFEFLGAAKPVPAVAAALLAALCLITSASSATPADTDRTAAWFNDHKDRPPLLRNFVQRLPKGADLHSHISGAVYAESYLRWGLTTTPALMPTSWPWPAPVTPAPASRCRPAS